MGGTTNISGGTITSTAQAGLSLSSGTLKMTNGTVTGNGDAGVYQTGGTFKLTGGTIYGKIYGIAKVGGSYSKSGSPSISGGTAATYGI